MKKRTLVIIAASLIAFAFLIIAAGAGIAVAYKLVKDWPGRSSEAIGGIALAQESPSSDQGILVSGIMPDSPAERAGIQRGDILLEVNGQEVKTLRELQKAVADLEDNAQLSVRVQHGDDIKTLDVELGDGDSDPYLGILTCEPMLDQFRVFRYAAGDSAYITEIVDGGPAGEAGLLVGDLITAVDGKSIDADNSLPDLLAAYQPGDQVTLSIQRTGEEDALEIEVTLGENPDDPTQAYLGVRYTRGPHLELRGGEDMPFRDGIPRIPGGPPIFVMPEGAQSGIIIGEVTAESPAEAAGLQDGDVITEVDGEAIDSPDEFVDIIQSHDPGDKVTMTLYRKNSEEAQQIEVALGENPEEAGTAYLGVTITGFFSNRNSDGLPDIDNLPSLRDFIWPEPPVKGWHEIET